MDTPTHTPPTPQDPDQETIPSHWPFQPADPLPNPIAPQLAKTCTQHINEAAQALCSQCGRRACASCISHDPDGFAICTSCNEPTDAFSPTPQPTSDSPIPATAAATATPLHTRVPFEDDTLNVSLFRRFVDTFKLFIFRPDQAFSLLNESSSLPRAAFLCYLCTLIGSFFSILWPLLLDSETFLKRLTETLAKVSAEQNIPIEQLEATARQGLFFALPLLPIFQILVGLLVFLAFTRLLGGTGRTRHTILIYAYASLAQLFAVVPFLGWIVSIFFLLTMQITGLRVLHNMTPIRAAFASVLSIMTLHLCGGFGAF